MLYLWALVAGMAGALGGWFAIGMLAAWIAGLLGMSDFEGQRSMFAFLFVGPLGGFLVMVLAIWAVLRVGKGRARLAPTLGRIGLVMAGVAAVMAAGIGLRLWSVDTYSDEAPPTLEFEIRVPAGMPLPDRSAVRVEVHTDKNGGDGYFADPWLRTERDHRVIAGGVPLAQKTSSRMLVVTLPGQPTRLFRLGLSRDPASTAAFGDWRPPDFVDAPDLKGPQPAPTDDPVTMRYRIRRAGEG